MIPFAPGPGPKPAGPTHPTPTHPPSKLGTGAPWPSRPGGPVAPGGPTGPGRIPPRLPDIDFAIPPAPDLRPFDRHVLGGS